MIRDLQICSGNAWHGGFFNFGVSSVHSLVLIDGGALLLAACVWCLGGKNHGFKYAVVFVSWPSGAGGEQQVMGRLHLSVAEGHLGETPELKKPPNCALPDWFLEILNNHPPIMVDASEGSE